MKKSLYFVVCFIFMFGLCGEVSAQACPTNTCNVGTGIDDGSKPIPLYINKTNNDNNGVSGGCGGKTSTSSAISSEEIKIDKDDEGKFIKCKYDCYDKYKIMVLIDHSKSMDRGDKMDMVEEMLDEIFKKADANDLMKVCYFGGCLQLSDGHYWFNADNQVALSYIKSKLTIGKANTDYISAFDRAISTFDNDDNYIPIVFFLTDGYPTQLGENGYALGYMSSARYAYESIKKMKKLSDVIKSNGKNIYSDSNAKIITVGIGLSSSDNFAKYILDPSSSNYNNLVNSSSNSEARKLKSLLDGNSNQTEIVSNVCSYPDKGGVISGVVDKRNVTNSNGVVTGYKHTITFSDLPFKSAASEGLINSNGICFFGVDNTSGVKFRYKTKNGTNYIDLTKGTDYDIIALNDENKYGGKYIYRLKGSSYLSHPNASYRLVWTGSSPSLTARMTNYSASGFDKNNTNIVWRSYLGKNIDTFASKISGLTTTDPTPSSKYFDTKYQYTNSHNKSVPKNIVLPDSYYIKENGRYISKKISVPILITENATFSAGNNLENGILVDSGRGFSIGNDVFVKNEIFWYYQFFANVSGSSNNVVPDTPILYIDGKKYTLDDIYINSSGSKLTVDNLDSAIWKYISNTSNNIILDISNDIKSEFRTVDSNDKDNSTAVMPLFVESDFSDCSANKVVYNSNSAKDNKKCVVTYSISQPKAYINRLTREFVYQNSILDETYENNELYLSECSSGSSGCNSNKYYIPYDQPKTVGKKDEGTGQDIYLPIYIKGNFSSVKGLELDFDNICNVSVDNGTMKTEPDQVKYRSIDINDPFPKAGNTYDKISSNWRDWYCSSGASNLCSVNGQNEARLSNSYSKIFYSISLNSDMISEINKDTIENERYTQFVKGTNKDDGLPSGFSSNGVSEFVTSKFKTLASVNDNSFCSVGEFYEKCDQR